MSDKLPALNNLAVPALTDLMYIVTPGIDPLGSFNITVADLQAFFNADVPLRIFTDVADHGNVLAAETTIETISIPAGTLAATGDFFEYVMEYSLVSLGVSKTIRYKFDSQLLNAAPWNNTLASTQGVQVGRVYRVTDTTCRCYITNTLPFVGQADSFTQFGDITVADMDVNALDFVVTLQGGASNDIVHKASHMYVTR